MKSLSLPENEGSVKLQLSCHRQWVSEDYQHPPLQRQHRVQSTTHEANSLDLTYDLERAPMDETLQSQGMLHVECVTQNNMVELYVSMVISSSFMHLTKKTIH